MSPWNLTPDRQIDRISHRRKVQFLLNYVQRWPLGCLECIRKWTGHHNLILQQICFFVTLPPSSFICLFWSYLFLERILLAQKTWIHKFCLYKHRLKMSRIQKVTDSKSHGLTNHRLTNHVFLSHRFTNKVFTKSRIHISLIHKVIDSSFFVHPWFVNLRFFEPANPRFCDYIIWVQSFCE